MEDPDGKKESLDFTPDYFGHEIYSKFFNVDDVEEGTWKLTIKIVDGEDITRKIPVEMSNIPDRAELISPSEGELVNTGNPEFEFELPEEGLRRATLRVQNSERNTIVFKDIPLDSNTFSLEETLEPGETYYWDVYTFISGTLPVRYQTLSETRSFEIDN